MGFVEVHAHGRIAMLVAALVLVAERVARYAGKAFAARAVVAIGHRVAAVLEVGIPLTAEHLKAAHGQGLGEGYLVHRAFIGLAALFVFRRAHGESAGR
ncbi:hypothetical protein D3C84_1008590 [compost metagenome]